MLIVLGGLPAVGKSTIARELAARMPAVYLRIDVIEQALRASGVLAGGVGSAGYAVAHALARANLDLGRSVIADSVNPLPATREAWRRVAAAAGTPVLEVEIVCSDPHAHRQRAEGRPADIDGHRHPSWAAIQAHDYEPWATPRTVLDSAVLSAQEAADAIEVLGRRLAPLSSPGA